MPDKKIKILLIEDEEMLANMYETKFKNEGFDIVKALDGEEGLKKAQEILPDFILLDIIMPKMDGFAVLKVLKENQQTKNIPISMVDMSIFSIQEILGNIGVNEMIVYLYRLLNQ